jgi:SAM-dependent methyltransferase
MLVGAGISKDRRVLDAGCGMAYGSRILAEGGAVRVAGVDIEPTIADAAGSTMPTNVELQVADVRSAPFPDDCFDLVVCFEVIEHVEDPENVLDEPARVLTPDGVLMISSPNRHAYPRGNPHHLHELTPQELAVALARHFERVQIARQHLWSTSVITTQQSSSCDYSSLDRCQVYSTAEVDVDGATYCLAVASNGELPAIADVAVLGKDSEFRHWVEQYRVLKGMEASMS